MRKVVSMYRAEVVLFNPCEERDPQVWPIALDEDRWVFLIKSLPACSVVGDRLNKRGNYYLKIAVDLMLLK